MASCLSIFRYVVSRPTAYHPRNQKLPQCSGQLRAFQIKFVDSEGGEVVAEAEEDELLLDVAEANDVDIPSSCRGGMCGTCVSKLITGEVDMSAAADLEECLTPEQLKAGYILPCSAVALKDCEIQWKDDWGVSTLEEWK